MERIHLPVILGCLILAASCREHSPAVEEDSRDLSNPSSDVCEVHRAELIEEIVVPADITVEFEIEYHRMMQSHFPNLGLAFAVDYPEQDSVTVEYCPECRQANRLWEEENQGDLPEQEEAL